MGDQHAAYQILFTPCCDAQEAGIQIQIMTCETESSGMVVFLLDPVRDSISRVILMLRYDLNSDMIESGQSKAIIARSPAEARFTLLTPRTGESILFLPSDPLQQAHIESATPGQNHRFRTHVSPACRDLFSSWPTRPPPIVITQSTGRAQAPSVLSTVHEELLLGKSVRASRRSTSTPFANRPRSSTVVILTEREGGTHPSISRKRQPPPHSPMHPPWAFRLASCTA